MVKLENYINQERENGRIREGSFRLTIEGASDLGIMIFNSLLRYINQQEDDPIFIQPEFMNLIQSALRNFDIFINQHRMWYDEINVSPKMLNGLSIEYSFEFGLIGFVIDYVNFMGRLAMISEGRLWRT